MAAGVREIAALPDPVGEVLERLPRAQRPRDPQGARAARRRRRRLRGAAERDDRRRGAVPEVGQRRRPARLLERRALERRAALAGRRARPRAAGVPDGAIVDARGRRPRGARRARDADALRRPDHPARRRGAEGGAARARDGAGDLRRIGQLPRLRRRERRPRARRARSSLNAKVQRPGVCNAAETLLVHARRRPRRSSPARSRRSREAGVELRGDERTRALAGVDRGRAGERRRTGTPSTSR